MLRSEVTVRPATPADAADIARVQVQGWHEAYTGRMPQSILDGLDVERSTNGWRRIIAGEFPGEESEVFVAEIAVDAASPAAGDAAHEPGGADGDAAIKPTETRAEIVGFASAGRSRDDDAVPDRRELFAIYVLAAHYGSGAGQALLDAMIGRDAASLWVLEDNPRARAFYARNGFVPDGAVKDDDRWGEPVREVRLVRGAVPAHQDRTDEFSGPGRHT